MKRQRHRSRVREKGERGRERAYLRDKSTQKKVIPMDMRDRHQTASIHSMYLAGSDGAFSSGFAGLRSGAICFASELDMVD